MIFTYALQMLLFTTASISKIGSNIWLSGLEIGPKLSHVMKSMEILQNLHHMLHLITVRIYGWNAAI